MRAGNRPCLGGRPVRSAAGLAAFWAAAEARPLHHAVVPAVKDEDRVTAHYHRRGVLVLRLFFWCRSLWKKELTDQALGSAPVFEVSVGSHNIMLYSLQVWMLCY